MPDNYLLEMQEIKKAFGGVKALDGVSLNLEEGETLALLGENGSGKSTLMTILSGIYRMDSGKILLDGQEAHIREPLDAKRLGIGIVHQEISLVDELSIVDNIFLGSELCRGGFMNSREMLEKAQRTLDEFHMHLPATTEVSKLSVAQKQMVEIAKASFFNARILILDEPTAALTDEEVEVLFQQMRRLKQKKVSIIFISHRLGEVMSICDRITILRDGKYIGTEQIREVTQEKIIYMMVGRDLKGLDYTPPTGGEPILEARHLCNEYLKDVSFELRRGEILGIAGLVGPRRTELARAIFGIDKLRSGELFLRGKPVKIHSPRAAIALGMGMVPEDRKGTGLIMEQTISFNVTLLVLKKFIRGIYVNKRKEEAIADQYANVLSIKMSGTGQPCENLSGGNQQKVVVGKWLAKDADILIFDEPTRGIDVGTKEEIYMLIRRLADQGVSIIMISSEMREIVDLSSRVLVMHEGRLVGTLQRTGDTDEDRLKLQEQIGRYMVWEGEASERIR